MKKRILASFLVVAFVLINTEPLYVSATTSTVDFNTYYDEIYGKSSSGTINKLINSFNVVSTEDIEGTHIVGPIATNSYAYGTRDFSVGLLNLATTGLPGYKVLIASDYSRGMPSYIGKFSYMTDQGVAKVDIASTTNVTTYSPSVAMNFGFENWEDIKDDRHLYVPTGTKIVESDNEYDPQYFIYADTNYILSPYNSGRSEILENDKYMGDTFTSVWNNIVNESESLGITKKTDGDTIGSGDFVTYYYLNSVDTTVQTQLTALSGATIEYYKVNSSTTKLTIAVDHTNNTNGNFIIIGSDLGEKITEINFDVDSSYNYTDGWAQETVITFLGEKINQSTAVINNLTISQFPVISFGTKSDPFTSATGLNNEYNEKGNKLIYNMPNLTGALTPTSANLPGHFILPQAEFWSVTLNNVGTSVISWHGGNLNGCVIAKAFHGGNIEMHMWAYDGATVANKGTTPVTFEFEAVKYLDGSLSSRIFDFKLKYWYDATDLTSGLENYHSYSSLESNDKDGVITDSVELYQAKTYIYTLQEEETSEPGIIKDKSVYQIEVDVTLKKTGTDSYSYKADISEVRVTQIVDENGNEISISARKTNKIESVDDTYAIASFYNETEKYTLPSTGGSGTQIYTICGLALMSTALIIGKKRGNKIC
ncbi:MAG: LPXTG cell wall anchor domain-containing protein [Clostridia bacterium]